MRALGGALAVLLCACTEPVPRTELAARLRAIERPNVVFVLVDTLRSDWLTPYGFERDTTPELARWAEQGVVFERVLAQSSWTKTSMASLLTSLWPRSHGVAKSTDGLADGAYTLSEAFHDAGYRTYGVQTNGWLHQSFGFHQGFDRYAFPSGGQGIMPKPTVWPHGERILDETRRILDSHEPGEPFFLYLHFMDVHEYAAPTEFQIFGTSVENQYRASIRWVDDVIERVRRELDQRGLLDRTIMAFASDHGETFGEHGVHGHARNVFTPVLRVPLVIRFPFAMEPIRIAEQVPNVDIAPSLIQLAGLPRVESFEGKGLMPLIAGAESGGERLSYASLTDILYPDARLQASVSDGTWTFARNLDGGREEFLFDRSIDPDENVNLVAIETAEAERMRALLDAYLASEPLAETARSDVRIDPQIERNLRALGYLD